MSHEDALTVLSVFHNMTITDVLALDTSKYCLLSRLLRSWRSRPKIRTRLLEQQNNICALSGEPLQNDGKTTHLDHIFTIKQGVAALENGATVGDTYTKLWDEKNLRAVTPKANYQRNKKRGAA